MERHYLQFVLVDLSRTIYMFHRLESAQTTAILQIGVTKQN
jgi:hypothetical protein